MNYEMFRCVCLHSQYSKQYLLKLLSLGIRRDGRMPDSMRPISLNVGAITSADGSSLLRCGDTVVICGVKLELVASPDSRAGFLVCNVDCGSSCLPEATGGAPSVKVQALTKQLQLLLKKYVSEEQMTVPDSEYVWVVNVDVLCLNHNGNLLDAVTLSAVAALRNVRIPTLKFVPEVVLSAGGRLPLLTPPLTVSFALLENWCLLDPCLEEERCAQGHLSMSLNENGTIAHLQQSGHKITEQELLRLSQLAMKRVTLLNELILHTSQ